MHNRRYAMVVILILCVGISSTHILGLTDHATKEERRRVRGKKGNVVHPLLLSQCSMEKEHVQHKKEEEFEDRISWVREARQHEQEKLKEEKEQEQVERKKRKKQEIERKKELKRLREEERNRLNHQDDPEEELETHKAMAQIYQKKANEARKIVHKTEESIKENKEKIKKLRNFEEKRTKKISDEKRHRALLAIRHAETTEERKKAEYMSCRVHGRCGHPHLKKLLHKQKILKDQLRNALKEQKKYQRLVDMHLKKATPQEKLPRRPLDPVRHIIRSEKAKDKKQKEREHKHQVKKQALREKREKKRKKEEQKIEE